MPVGRTTHPTPPTPLFEAVALLVFCVRKYEEAELVPADIGHNELLGGDGNDTIHAGRVK